MATKTLGKAKTLGKVSLTTGGTYNAATTYARLTMVLGNDGCGYITRNDNTVGVEPGVTAGWQNSWMRIVERGSGNGIADIVKTSTSGNVDTYTITYDNGDTTTFTVTNGDDYVLTNEDKVEIAGIVDDLLIIQEAGTDPVITADANTKHICGQCYTLSFTPSSSGICAVVFTSGSTPTVLTIPNTVMFPDWFDKGTLDTNTIYEINVSEGVYGVVTTWSA